VRVKKELNTRGVERIKGLTSRELADRCPDLRSVFPIAPCANCGCEYAINEPGYMNCSFVAAEVSEHTLEAIGEMMGVSREGIRKIEERALRKFREGMDKLQNNDRSDRPTLCKPGLAPGPNHIDTNGEVAQFQDATHSVSDNACRKLA